MLDAGPVRIRLHVDSLREQITDHNVVGELPGTDEDTVVIGSHHDGPWSSAVEDASGMALVFALAAYWSKVPAGVPLVNYLTAPFYLFDPMDTMDKVHVPSLVPVTRAAIRLIDSTKGVSAAAMRSAVTD